MEPRTLIRTIRPANSGKGGVGGRNNWDKVWPVESSEGSPSIKLGLGIGGSGSGGPSRVVIKSGFTPLQLQELNLQALIFKYILAGLPVPVNLLLPIWKSVAAHFGSAFGGFYKQFPSFLGFSYKGVDYRSMMDPEPGRCRRTDGKKWRCSRDVIPDQKYCERHMHRGRLRSRKHVEAPDIASYSGVSAALNSSKTFSACSIRTYNTSANHSNSLPLSLQLKTPSDDISRGTPTTVVAGSSSINSIRRSNCILDVNKGFTAVTTVITPCTFNNGSKNNVSVNSNVDVNRGSTPTPTPIATGPVGDGSKSIVVKKEPITTSTINSTFGSSNNGNSNNCIKIEDGFVDHINEHNINRGTNFGANGTSGNKSTGFGFSPRSVLQGGTVAGSSNPCFNHGNADDPEPQRCRRTDGKKWRCSRDVHPDQKYCVMHMNRGAKRLLVDPHQVTVAVAPITDNAQLGPPPGIPIKAEKRVKLNTNLSISIPENPQPTTNGGKSTSSSSSDATTISDEFINDSH